MELLDKPVRRHDWLAQELLTIASHTDANRLAMFDHNLPQALVLNSGEFPRVFTGYERQLWGPTGYSRAKTNLNVIEVVEKHMYSRMIFFTDENGVLDCELIESYENFTENFGHAIKTDVGKTIRKGSRVARGDLLYHSSGYDKNLNPLYGCNLNVAYMSWNNMTYEDAVIISDSTAKRMSTNNVSNLFITINTNDVPLPLYANDRFMPEIGENIKDFILLATRRWSVEELLTDLDRDRMLKINPMKDTCIYTQGGFVTDIMLYNNCPSQKWDSMISMNPQLQQMNRVMLQQRSFWISCLDVMKPYIDNNLPRSPNVNFFYSRFVRAVQPDNVWSYDGRKFDFVVMKVTVANHLDLDQGGKLVNRYGGKGCISSKLPDYDGSRPTGTRVEPNMMPVGADGTRIDVILNQSGIVARMNPGALHEIELNRIASKLTSSIFANLRPVEDLFYVTELLDPEWGATVRQSYLANPEIFMESLGRYGPYLRIKPFYNTLDLNTLKILYRFVPEAIPTPVYIPHIGCQTERSIVVGEMYMLRLKHDAYTKLIARGAGSVSSKNMPGKSKAYNRGEEPHNTTPIRLGEQEQNNLLLMFADNPRKLRYLMNTRSTNYEDRTTIARALLAGKLNELKPEDFDKTSNCNTIGLNELLATIGVELVSEKKIHEK